MSTITTDRAAEIEFARLTDTEIARLWDEFHTANDQLDSAKSALNKALENRDGKHWLFTVGGTNWLKNEERITELTDLIEKLIPIVSARRKRAADYDAAHYTGWSRFFLVKHIHNTTRCSSFRITTRVGWLPSVSGLTEAEAVAEHGATLCTICFPSAPTELTTAQADPTICTAGRDVNGPSRSGYVSGNWGTCLCGATASLTSAGNLRKHKAANA